MDTISVVKGLLAHTLQIERRVDAYTADSPLLGAIPELDSMAVVNLITAMEEHYGFVVQDDEITAEAFATLGSLARFVDRKLRQ